MIALDTNALVSLLVSSQPTHQNAAEWLKKNKDSLAITSINLGEVFRLLTHPRVFPNPLPLFKAIELVETFINDFDISVLTEEPEWWIKLKELSTNHPSIIANEVFDARIALCLQYNGVKKIMTYDDDFKKYSFLQRMVF